MTRPPLKFQPIWGLLPRPFYSIGTAPPLHFFFGGLSCAFDKYAGNILQHGD